MSSSSQRAAGPEQPPAPADIASDDVLLAGLRSIFRDVAAVSLVDRTPNAHASSAPSEVVRAWLGHGPPQSLFCKYDAGSRPDPDGHRRGVAYEARVYRDLLATTGATAPRYRGTWTVPGRGTCLVVDALTTAATLRRHPPDRMLDAAAWIGRFHRQATRELGRPELGFLARYDREHIWSWMSRAQRQATEHGLSLPWLTDLAGRFEGMVTELTSDPPAVIHGEFYPLNILASDAHIHPIDWESAGIGPGEIDLASLVMGWPDPIAAKCRSSYAQSRWPEGVPPGFAARLQAATLYLCLRMLGDNQRPSAPAGGLPFFDYLHRTAVTCGLLPANG